MAAETITQFRREVASLEARAAALVQASGRVDDLLRLSLAAMARVEDELDRQENPLPPEGERRHLRLVSADPDEGPNADA